MIGALIGLAMLGQPALENTPWLAEKLEAIRAAHSVPSLSASVMVDGKEVAHAAVGVRIVGTEDCVTLADRYHFGSITKSVTATLFGILVEKGKLKWDTTIGDVWKDETIKPAFRKVTVTQLLSHRSGLSAETYFPDGPDYFNDKRPIQVQRREYALRALAEEPENAPGTEMVYSNRGYIVAAAIAEQVMGDSWEHLVTQLVFKPLHMKTAGFGPVGNKDLPGGLGHLVKDGKVTAVPFGPYADNAPVVYPAGGVHASVEDMLKYGAMHAGVPPVLLSPTTLDYLHESKGDGYACGWISLTRSWAPGTIVTHNGSNTMNYAEIWVAPSRKFALVIGCNQGGDEATKAVQDAASMIVTTTMVTGIKRS